MHLISAWYIKLQAYHNSEIFIHIATTNSTAFKFTNVASWLPRLQEKQLIILNFIASNDDAVA